MARRSYLNNGNPFYGKKHSMETKEKMKNAWNKRKEKIITEKIANGTLGKRIRPWDNRNKELCREMCRQWKRNNKEKMKVYSLIRRKIIIPKNTLCEICKINLAIDRHHEDYSKPFEVIFVCKRCHNILNIKRIRRKQI